MKKIYKYEIEPENPFKVEMPKGAKLLTAGTQNNAIFVWAEVDTEAENEERFIEVFGTGWPMGENMGVEREYLGTIFMGVLVLHAYERIN